MRGKRGPYHVIVERYEILVGSCADPDTCLHEGGEMPTRIYPTLTDALDAAWKHQTHYRPGSVQRVRAEPRPGREAEIRHAIEARYALEAIAKGGSIDGLLIAPDKNGVWGVVP